MSSAARVRTDPRISRRRKAVARARRRRLTYQLTGALSGALLVWIVLWSPLLRVRTVDVEGASHITPAQVSRIAGINEEDNLLFVSSSDITRSVRELPWVKSVKVDRILPSTVRVRVVEREPAMLVTSAAGTWTLDGTGRVLEAGGEERGLPALVTSDTDELAPGDTIDQLAVRAAVRALGSMPPELKDKVRGVFAPTSERVSFAMQGGLDVRYGSADELRDKHEVVLALLERLRESGSAATYLDVRVPSNPAVALNAPAEEDAEGETETVVEETTAETDDSVD